MLQQLVQSEREQGAAGGRAQTWLSSTAGMRKLQSGAIVSWNVAFN